MSRSGYGVNIDNWALIRWRGAVASAIRGKRGQSLLRDTLAALDAMPEKELITDELKADGKFCTLGAVGYAKGINIEELNPYEYNEVAKVFNIAAPLAQEIVYMNDEGGWSETPSQRWKRMRNWIAKQIIEVKL